MASSEEQAMQFAAQLGKPLKEGERILGPTRRPDGTLRKPIRIRAGYVPQDEVAIYQSRGSLWRKEMESQVVPGYDPSMDSKPKSKSVKRNEKKKEKKLQAALEKSNNSEQIENENVEKHAQAPRDASQESKSVESITPQMKQLGLSTSNSAGEPSSDTVECVDSTKPISDIDKKIRALKKKIRLTKAVQQKNSQQDMNPEQLEKMKKLESWQEEIKLLEEKKAELAS